MTFPEPSNPEPSTPQPSTSVDSGRSAAPDDLLDLAQRCHLLLETLHAVVYFAAEPAAEYLTLGLKGRPAYFASRAAPLGAVPGPVVTATFGAFEPAFVERTFPRAWELAPPADWTAARHRGVAAALRRVLGQPNGGQPDVGEALELTREATTALQAAGRPLYAANAALPWPAEPLMALWHAATLLREHRGDGHQAVLTSMGVGPVPAMVLHGLVSKTTPFLHQTRGWSEQVWAQTVVAMQQEGLLEAADADRLTPAGLSLKGEIEQRTRAAALPGWRHLGERRCRRLIELLTPIREQLMAGDVFPQGSPLRP